MPVVNQGIGQLFDVVYLFEILLLGFIHVGNLIKPELLVFRPRSVFVSCDLLSLIKAFGLSVGGSQRDDLLEKHHVLRCVINMLLVFQGVPEHLSHLMLDRTSFVLFVNLECSFALARDTWHQSLCSL